MNWTEVGRVSGPCVRPGGPALTERALEICGLPPNSLVADIGCGPGGTLEYLEQSGLYAVGLDSSETLLGDATSRVVSGRLARGYAETLPFKKETFDALFCECVLSVLAGRMTALREFSRVLKGRGFLIMSDLFRHTNPGQERSEGESQGIEAKGLLSKEDLLGVLAGFGFSILLWEENRELLKEFVVRMIFAGARFPDLWGCTQGQEGTQVDRREVSYFLLVARKQANSL